MELTAAQYALICPLVFLAGFVDAVAGGGGLISLPAYLMSGLPIHFVIGTNKLSSCMGTAVATFKFARSGYVKWRPALAGMACALVGSSLGAHIALYIDPEYFRVIILVVLPCTAAYVMMKKSIDTDKPPYGETKTAAVAMACALIMGVYDGFYGPGTGTFLLLLLVSAAHMKLTDANGMAKVINLSTNAAALTVFLLNDAVLVGLGLTAGLFNIAGNYLGARYFQRNGAGSVKKIILAVLVLFFAKTLWDIFLS